MKGPATHFHGWTDAVLDFYEGLEVDNSLANWQSRQKVYDEEVRGPMEALLGELCDEVSDAKMFRPHRDIRFSADKGAGAADRGRPASRHVDDAADRDHLDSLSLEPTRDAASQVSLDTDHPHNADERAFGNFREVHDGVLTHVAGLSFCTLVFCTRR